MRRYLCIHKISQRITNMDELVFLFIGKLLTHIMGFEPMTAPSFPWLLEEVPIEL